MTNNSNNLKLYTLDETRKKNMPSRHSAPFFGHDLGEALNAEVVDGCVDRHVARVGVARAEPRARRRPGDDAQVK